jgi:anaerobic magnesium-protoporphyrin IX monomethyl ester cyclase
MKVTLVGAELEENLGLRYIASSLEAAGHETVIIPFNSPADIPDVVRKVTTSGSDLTGLSMIFTIRGGEFCQLAGALRQNEYRGHINAGGPFASFNAENLLRDFSAFDSIALGEGEELMPALAENLGSLSRVRGLCYRASDGSIVRTKPRPNPDNLDILPFPKRDHIPVFFNKPLASMLSSRGCWRNCAFCSINAWFSNSGGKRFRLRSVENIVREMKDLYDHHGVRIFNFQDDNFYHPDPTKALARFTDLRDCLKKEGLGRIGIAIKARPDSITRESVRVLSDLGLFRVFLGVENASEHGLINLNRRQTIEDILRSLEILNDADIHVAYNYLLFEPETVMEDILINLRFMERHNENPCNFCRAEVHACTGLEEKLKSEGLLLGDYFNLDYRIKDRHVELFHQIANHAFFDRNFNDEGLHYFTMEIDFVHHLLQIFYPEVLIQSLRALSRNFVRQTNLDTYQHLSEIYDYVMAADVDDQVQAAGFAHELKSHIDSSDIIFKERGRALLSGLNDAYLGRNNGPAGTAAPQTRSGMAPLVSAGSTAGKGEWIRSGILSGFPERPIPYDEFKTRIR